MVDEKPIEQHKEPLVPKAPKEILNWLTSYFEDLVVKIPESAVAKADDPEAKSRALIRKAALKAATISGGLALPAGPLGLITVLPDLAAVYRIQQQLVSDVAGAHGQRNMLTPQAMAWCLFKHAAAQVLRDFLVRGGERALTRGASGLFRRTLEQVAVSVTKRVAGRSIMRWLPIVGAAGVAAYAYYDTATVGRTAMDYFAGVARGREPEWKRRGIRHAVRGFVKRARRGKVDIPPDEAGTVLVTAGGQCYHQRGCSRLKGNGEPIPLEEAVLHYEPCRTCCVSDK